MVTAETMQKIELVNEVCTPNKASEVVKGLLSQRINTLKTQKLHTWLCDSEADNYQLKDKINQLIHKKGDLEALLQEAARDGLKVSVNTTVEISIID